MAARLSGAKTRIGSAKPREGPARSFYTRPVVTQGTHVVEHALSLASAVAGEDLPYEPPVFPQDPPLRRGLTGFMHRSGGSRLPS